MAPPREDQGQMNHLSSGDSGAGTRSVQSVPAHRLSPVVVGCRRPGPQPGNPPADENVLSTMSIPRWRFLKFWPSLATDPPGAGAQMWQRAVHPGARVPGMAPPGHPA
ncbi:hypothetical protein GCM10008960_20970 [Deinococcus sedimenti]|uniref:Uncharacterized protein n=1 Tax=Deinococcus sedimenti TaxID=1867090 RepID=A0ABQ2S3V4_9DEIO|nr:hypothetical protein GCM10008960_20970 [Deinococcus sedimenti]